MKIQIEVQLPDNLIQAAADAAVEKAFRPPQYRDSSGGEGYEQIRGSVLRALLQVDFTEQIRQAIRAQSTPVIHEVVKAELKRVAREQLRGLDRQKGLLGDRS